MKWRMKTNDEISGETQQTIRQVKRQVRWQVKTNDEIQQTNWPVKINDEMTGENKWLRTGEVSNYFSNGV